MSQLGSSIGSKLKMALASPGRTAVKGGLGLLDAVTGASQIAKDAAAGTVGGTLAAASGAGLLYGGVVKPLMEAAHDDEAELFRDNNDAALQTQLRGQALAQALRAERLKRNIDANKQLLLQMNPELANQLQAGRRLPRGAVVIGGRKREKSFLDLVAAQLSEGVYNQPVPLSEQLMMQQG